MSNDLLQVDYDSIIDRVLTGELDSQLAAYDRQRSLVKKIGMALIVPGLILLLGSHILKFREIGAVCGMLLMIAGGVIMAWFYKRQRDFYRRQVMVQLIRAMDMALTYFPDKGLSRSRFQKFKLFGSFDRYRSEDLLSGTVGKTSFEAAEVHIERRRKTKKSTSYVTIFRGVVFIADFNKKFNCRTAILPDVAERCFGKLVGNFLQNLNFSKEGKLVKLENVEFEKHFAVYSDDQHEARYLLTPGFMERLLAVQAAEKSPIRVLFLDNNLVMTFTRSGGWLEPPFTGSISSREMLERSLREVVSVLDIIQKLDLNTRIWSKQPSAAAGDQ